ncbi:MAG: amidohydrolase family protein [Desulfarculus sp.]|nr:amidohydrolase family protein [Desulfarculus sp.]
MTIIDAHTHAFLPEDLEVLSQRLTLLDDHLPADNPHKWQILDGGGTLEALAAIMERAGVDRYVLLPVSGKKDRVADLNRWAASAAVDDPRLIPFGLLHPQGQVAQDLELLLDLGLKGVKLHPFIQRFSLDDPASQQMLSLLEPSGLPVLLDTLFIEGLVRAKPHLDWVVKMFNFGGCEAAQIARAAKAHPGQKFIAAHGGSLYGWDHLDPLYDLDNVYFDLSYLMGLLEPPRLVQIIRRKGPERVIYGSDAPWREASAFRQWFEDLPLSPGEREQIASGTLLSLLGQA